MGILLTEAAEVASQVGDEAAQQTNAGVTGLVMTFALYGLFAVAMWFFLIRPQSKERKRTAAMLASLEIGDCVMTTSGFYGIVIDIDNDANTVIVEFGNNRHCRIPMDKGAISRVEKPEN